MKPKDKSINLRLPEELYDAVRQRDSNAESRYQRFIRMGVSAHVAAGENSQ